MYEFYDNSKLRTVIFDNVNEYREGIIIWLEETKPSEKYPSGVIFNIKVICDWGNNGGDYSCDINEFTQRLQQGIIKFDRAKQNKENRKDTKTL